MNSNKWIREAMQDMPVIDTHEHLETESARMARHKDFISLYMTHYASTDVLTAGLPAEKMELLRGTQLDVREKWAILRPYWELCRNTAYFRALERISIDLFGVTHLDDDTLLQLNSAFLAASRPGWYRQILKDICHIDYCVQDDLFIPDLGSISMPDPLYYRESAKYDHFLEIGGEIPAASIMGAYRKSFTTLGDYVNLLGDTVQKAKRERSIVSLKSAIAYGRTLQFDNIALSEAEAVFDRILRGDSLTGAQRKPLQDYLMHSLLGFAGDLSLPFQIHTGLQEGLGGNLPDSRPSHLIYTFRQHPDVKFDVFHTGYPYGYELAAICKQFRNVHVDMCWVHVISQEYAVRILEEMLEVLPSNKILGFGGDFLFVEGTYAHLQFAKENIAEVLSRRIENGRLDKSDALVLAKRLLHDNAQALFGGDPS
jgi:uncharacterized protein